MNSLPTTLNFDMKRKLEALNLNARMSLAQLYSLNGVDRPADVIALLDSVNLTMPEIDPLDETQWPRI